ncbi:hypothetical protein BGW80DRAFT_1343861 [Lactifluus volemus]|nr:hypothetical protein BGW80DRAFT_1343861 [Lactifluus volemus]
MSMTLQDVVGRAVRLTDVEQRQYFRLGLMVTGDVATHLKRPSVTNSYFLFSF